MTSREQAFKRLREDTSPMPDGELFTVGFYQPSDGYGVSRLMYAVYGDGHPIDTYYIPEALTAANQSGDVKSVVARTADGQVVCHEAFYRSSAPNPAMYEIGMGLTLPAYRGSLAFARCSSLLLSLLEEGTVTAAFGEAVCNHLITQKVSRQTNFIETALEIELMPADTYAHEQASPGRVSCLMVFRISSDRPRPLCIPDCYAGQISFMMEGLDLERQPLQPSDQPLPATSVLQIERFSSAGVCRCCVSEAGADLADRLAALEQELRAAGYVVLQCFVPLGTPAAAATVATLRSAGFFLGGFLPAWFGDDGLLLQKLFVTPCFDDIKLYSERARTILEMVKADWQRSREGLPDGTTHRTHTGPDADGGQLC